MIKCREILESEGQDPKLYFPQSGGSTEGKILSASVSEDGSLYFYGAVASFDTLNKEISSDFLIEDNTLTSPSISFLDLESFLPGLNFKRIKLTGSTLPMGLVCVSLSEDLALNTNFPLAEAGSGSSRVSVWKIADAHYFSINYPRYNITDLVHFLRICYKNTDRTLTNILQDIADVFHNVGVFNNPPESIEYGSEIWFNILNGLLPSYIKGTYSNIELDQNLFLSQVRNIPAPTINICNPGDSNGSYITLELLKDASDSFRNDLKIFYILRSQEQGFLVPNSSSTWIEYTLGTKLGRNSAGSTYFDEEHNFVGQITAITTTASNVTIDSRTSSQMISKPSSKDPENNNGDVFLFRVSTTSSTDEELIINPEEEVEETLAGAVLG